jgi:hypothetical protein
MFSQEVRSNMASIRIFFQPPAVRNAFNRLEAMAGLFDWPWIPSVVLDVEAGRFRLTVLPLLPPPGVVLESVLDLAPALAIHGSDPSGATGWRYSGRCCFSRYPRTRLAMFSAAIILRW